MEVGSIEVIKKLVELDFGVSVVPNIAVQHEVKHDMLQTVRVFEKRDWRLTGIVYPRKGIANITAEVFVSMLKKTLARHPTVPSAS